MLTELTETCQAELTELTELTETCQAHVTHRLCFTAQAAMLSAADVCIAVF